MAEYIEREAVIRVVNGKSSLTMTRSGLIDSIINLPAADVAPVVHGRWIEDASGIIICPKCKRGYNLIAKFTNYCPACGAKMDGGNS